MNESVKAIAQLAMLILAAVTLCAWGLSRHPDAVVWACRLGAPIGIAAIGWVLWRAGKRADKAPDLLRERVSRQYYDQGGFCFMPTLHVGEDGLCRVSVYYQNRYSGVCEGEVWLRPPAKSFSFGKRDLPEIHVKVACGNGAFGVMHVPMGIQRKYHGKKLRYEVAAASKYAGGRGEQLRFGPGMRAGKPGGDAARVALSLLGALGGVIIWHRSAAVTWTIPKGVLECVPEGTGEQHEVLWGPEAAAYGFPVVV